METLKTRVKVTRMNDFNTDLRKMSSQSLMDHTRSLIGEERKLTLAIIECLEELERRKTYLARGCSSLFEMCVKEFGYSESQAHRRISAMRVARELPEIKEVVEAGRLTIATLSMAQSFFRQEEKFGAKSMSVPEKRALLKDLEGKSKREVERELVERTSVPENLLSKPAVALPVQGDKTRLEVVLTREQFEKLQRLQAVLSHSVPDGDWATLLEKMADVTLEKVDPVKRSERRKPVASQAGKSLSPGKADPKPQSRYVPVQVRDRLMSRSGNQCSYVDPKTKRRCEETRLLQIDHIQSHAHQGSNDAANLQVLCRAHNQYRAMQTFGTQHMKKWLSV